MKLSLFAGVVAVVFSAANASAEIKCRADFSAFKPGAFMDVQIDDETQAKVSGSLNVAGALKTFKDAQVLNFSVRSGLDVPDLSNIDALKLNPGEQRVALIQSYLSNPEMKSLLRLDGPLNLKEVTAVRIYDLGNDAITNQFGGSPLVDLRNAKGELVGRFMQGVAITSCK